MSRRAAAPVVGEAGAVRFGPRVDRWMSGAVGAALLATLVAGVAPALDPAASARDFAVTMGTSLTVIVLAVALTVPVRYEIGLDELLARAPQLEERRVGSRRGWLDPTRS